MHLEVSAMQSGPCHGNRSSSQIISKAKLGPLQYKGETTRNELAGATFGSRLKCCVIENTGLEFGRHFHFLDSMIVKDMIRKESYGLNTCRTSSSRNTEENFCG